MESPILRIKTVLTFFLAAGLLTLSGCGGGSKMIKVKGNLTDKGKPMIRDQGTLVTLHFIPIEGGHTYPAKVQVDKGTYEVEMRVGTYNVKFLSMKGMGKEQPKPEGNGKKISPYRDIKTGLELKDNQTLDLEISP